METPPVKILDPEFYGFTQDDMQHKFAVEQFAGHQSPVALQDILAQLNAIYSQHIGVEYMHLDDAMSVSGFSST